VIELLFANPSWLAPCGALVAGCGAALALAFWRARGRSRRLLGTAAAAGPGAALADATLWLALGLLVLALLGPRMGHQRVSVSTAGVDTVVLLDVSQSMRARDVPPSRLDRARRIGHDLLARLEPGDRAALSAYAARGVVLTPLSPDTAALRTLLAVVDEKLITPASSNLRDGVERALEAFEPASERARVLVLLSDGGSEGHGSDTGVASAIRANVRVVGVALGSEIGSTIPNGGAPLLDASQRVVVSRRRREPLQQLADATDGRLFVADEFGDVDVEALTREVRRSVDTAQGDWVEQHRTVPLVLPFAALAFGLLWLELAGTNPAPERARRLLSRTSARLRERDWLLGRLPGPRALRDSATVALVCVPLLLIGAATFSEREAADQVRGWEAVAHVRALEDSERLRFALARARAQQREEALHSFRAVAFGASDLALAATAYHDIGVIALERGDLETARDAFFDSLALAPHGETRFNLEWTLQALTAQPSDPEPDRQSDPPQRSGHGKGDDQPAPDDRGEPEKSTPSTADQESDVPASRRDDPRAAARDESEAPASPGTGRGDEKRAAAQAASRRPLDPEVRERWLERTRDDPARALQSAANSAEPEPHSGEPAW
jgi:hypothetical protein